MGEIETTKPDRRMPDRALSETAGITGREQQESKDERRVGFHAQPPMTRIGSGESDPAYFLGKDANTLIGKSSIRLPSDNAQAYPQKLWASDPSQRRFDLRVRTQLTTASPT